MNFAASMPVIEHPQREKPTQEIQMKKLLTISAVVFLMIFTAGLAAAKKPVVSFPFTGTGDLVSINDTGATGTPVSATITVNKTGGLFWGTIVYGTTTIQFSAVQDISGVYSFTGQTVPATAASDVAPAIRLAVFATETVTGAFTISEQKEPGSKHKVFAAAIEFMTLDPFATSYAGLLFQ
jgi:hypothetical protein